MFSSSDNTVEIVRQATDIVDIISRYVHLQKRGRNYVGLCPFHSEKTPSFNVNREKGLYYCFGCGAGGNVFTFLTQYEHISFGEALRQLAQQAGIQLPEYGSSKQSAVDLIYQANEAAARFYQSILFSKEGRTALNYLQRERHLSEETIKKFVIGYAPDRWDSLTNFFKSRGTPLDVAQSAGLLSKKNDSTGFFDRFRARIMFPIISTSGRVIAFGGRTIKPDEKAKYINSPETPAYIKGKTLFGLYHTKDSIIEKDAAILVEGYADLIALYQSGIKNVVASSGTALTPDQTYLISRYTRNVYLVYDADTAGQEASIRGAELLLEQGMNVFIVQLPPGEDPDTFVLSKGAEAFLNLVINGTDIVEFKLNLLTGRKDERLDEAKLIHSIVDTLSRIEDPIKVNLYSKKLAEKFGIREETIYQELKRRKSPKEHYNLRKELSPSLRMSAAEKDLVNLLVNIEQSLYDVVAAHVGSLQIQNPVTREIINQIIKARNEGRSPSSIIDELSSEEMRRIFAELIFATPQRSRIWWEEIRPGSETPDYLKWISQLLISFEMEQLEVELRLLSARISEAEKNNLTVDEYDKRYSILLQRKALLSRTYGDKELLEKYFESIRSK
ncbi:MAG: DNA primase [Candidatus Kryptoniota bacterium]